jgi:hypothetical protein
MSGRPLLEDLVGADSREIGHGDGQETLHPATMCSISHPCPMRVWGNQDRMRTTHQDKIPLQERRDRFTNKRERMRRGAR